MDRRKFISEPGKLPGPDIPGWMARSAMGRGDQGEEDPREQSDHNPDNTRH